MHPKSNQVLQGYKKYRGLTYNKPKKKDLHDHEEQGFKQISEETLASSMANQEAKKQEEEEEEYGVLLYYKYTTIPDLQQLFNFYESICNTLSLLGRVRLSPNGVNVTVIPLFSPLKMEHENPHLFKMMILSYLGGFLQVGGKLSALEEHIVAVKLNSLFEGTDFKLASCHEPSNDRVAKECGFTSLSIRIVKVGSLISFCSFLSVFICRKKLYDWF